MNLRTPDLEAQSHKEGRDKVEVGDGDTDVVEAFYVWHQVIVAHPATSDTRLARFLSVPSRMFDSCLPIGSLTFSWPLMRWWRRRRSGLVVRSWWVLFVALR